jgi:hypothetical protein
LIMAYQGSPLEEIKGGVSAEVRQQQIFAAYAQRMFQRRSIETRYTSAQTIYWLTWLAKQMRQRNQTEFYIERLQIDWLSKSRQGQLYTSLALGLLCLLIVTGVDGDTVYQPFGWVTYWVIECHCLYTSQRDSLWMASRKRCSCGGNITQNAKGKLRFQQRRKEKQGEPKIASSFQLVGVIFSYIDCYWSILLL